MSGSNARETWTFAEAGPARSDREVKSPRNRREASPDEWLASRFFGAGRLSRPVPTSGSQCGFPLGPTRDRRRSGQALECLEELEVAPRPVFGAEARDELGLHRTEDRFARGLAAQPEFLDPTGD